MAFVLEVSQRVQFQVAGTLRDERGEPQPFDFTLTCRRLSTDAYRDAVNGKRDADLVNELLSWIESWDGIKDASGQNVPFNEDAARQLLGIPGMAALIFTTYGQEAGAKAKN